MFLDGEFRARQKGRLPSGKTKRGRGTKWMVVVDGQVAYSGSHLTNQRRPEVLQVLPCRALVVVGHATPPRVIADRAYDSDPTCAGGCSGATSWLRPIPKNRRCQPPTMAAPCAATKRWKVERTFAWLGNFRRLVVRYDHDINRYPRLLSHRLCPHHVFLPK